jgi:hypothetical protein
MDFLTKVLFYLLIFIWIIPPIMQYKERYFYFFLLLGLTEIFAVALNWIFNINPKFTYISFSYFLILSLLSKEEIKRYWYGLGLIFLLIILFLFNVSGTKHSTLYYSIFIIFHLLIFLRILLTFIIEIDNENSVKFFLLVFLLYELTIIFKFVNIIAGFVDAYPYFIITSIFEIFIGLFFSIFKEDDTRIILKLK